MSTNGEHAESDVVNGSLDAVADKLAPIESGGHVHGIFEDSSSGKDPDAVTMMVPVGDDGKEKRQCGKLERKVGRERLGELCG